MRRGYPHLERQPAMASLDGREPDGKTMRVRFSSQVSFVADGWLPSLTWPVHDEPWGEQGQEVVRCDGKALCPDCRREIRDHPLSPGPLDYLGEPFVHLLCDGTLAKT